MSNEAITWAFKQELPMNEKFVLVSLADYADENYSCFPSRKKTAERVGCSPRTVTTLIAKLSQRGLIEIQERTRDGGLQASNRYVLKVGVENLSNRVETDCHPGWKQASTPGGNGLPTNNPHITLNEPKKDNRAKALSSYDDDFENLWKSYKATNKGTKKTAASRYKTLRKKYSANQIQDFMNHYLITRARAERSGEFVPNFPNLSTWLNQEKWEDFGEYREGSQTKTIQRPSMAPMELSKEEVDQILGPDNYSPVPTAEAIASGNIGAWMKQQHDERFKARQQQAMEKINGK